MNQIILVKTSDIKENVLRHTQDTPSTNIRAIIHEFGKSYVITSTIPFVFILFLVIVRVPLLGTLTINPNGLLLPMISYKFNERLVIFYIFVFADETYFTKVGSNISNNNVYG